MRGTKTTILNALLLAATLPAFGADPDYFPLAVGNSWVYKVTEGRIPDVQTVEVTSTTSFDGRDYYAVKFFERDAFLRMATDGTLFEYDSSGKREKVWVAFGSDPGQAFTTEIDSCNKTGKIDSKAARYSGAIGNFTNALQVTFTQSCADAGIQNQIFLPYVGLVQHVVDNIAGARKYTLIYSRTGVTEVTTSEIRFSLSLDSATYPADAKTATPEMMARLTMRNTTPDPIVLQFPSAQSYDLKIRNEKGDVVYVWSADKIFAQVLRTETFNPGERNYIVRVPLPGLPTGKYVVDAYLTTAIPASYAASVGFNYR
jgi:hypothetical protein